MVNWRLFKVADSRVRKALNEVLEILLAFSVHSNLVLNMMYLLELSFHLMGLCIGSWSPIVFHWLFCIHNINNSFPLVVHPWR